MSLAYMDTSARCVGEVVVWKEEAENVFYKLASLGWHRGEGVAEMVECSV